MLSIKECIKELEDHLQNIEMDVNSIENGAKKIIHAGMDVSHLHVQSARKDYAITVAALITLKNPVNSDAIILTLAQIGRV